MANNQKTIIWVLSIIIAILVLIGLYFFVFRPEKLAYDNTRRLEGMNLALGSILQGVQQQGFTQIPISKNQSVILAYVTPQELKLLTQIRQQQAAAQQQQASKKQPEQQNSSA